MEELKCSVCGSVVNPGDSFCQNCGSPVVAPAPVENVTEVKAEEPVMPAAPVMPEAPAAPVMPAAPEAPVMPEAPAAPETPDQQETTVLSGNPFGLSGDAQSSAPEVDTVPNPAPNPTMNATYQQAPAADMNYQGTYNGTYTNPTYTQATAATPAKKSGKAMGIIALVLGIIGLLTSCCYGGYLFGLIAIILGIVAVVKQKGKATGIAGLIIGALAFIISIVFTFIGAGFWSAIRAELNGDDYGYDDDFGFDDDFDFDDDYNNISYSSVTGTNQMMVDGIVYTMPASLDSLGLSVNDYYSDVVSDIETNGMYAGDYEFVILNTEGGTSFWGYIENTGSDTIYNVGELQLTGINVDNYSYDCTAYSAEVYGGVTLYMSRDEVESLIGTCDYTEDGLDCYESENGSELLRIEYDEYDSVCALDITIY